MKWWKHMKFDSRLLHTQVDVKMANNSFTGKKIFLLIWFWKARWNAQLAVLVEENDMKIAFPLNKVPEKILNNIRRVKKLKAI
jgi:hypothetical protein